MQQEKVEFWPKSNWSWTSEMYVYLVWLKSSQTGVRVIELAHTDKDVGNQISLQPTPLPTPASSCRKWRDTEAGINNTVVEEEGYSG